MSRVDLIRVMVLLVSILVAASVMATPENSIHTSSVSESTLTLAAVGDLMIGSWGQILIEKFGADYPFQDISTIIKSADIATGNLEGPHCETGQAMEAKKYVFRMPIEQLDAYRNAGFDVFTLANNHSMDFGSDCLMQCIEALNERDLKHCGAGKNLSEANQPAVIVKNGISIGILGYSATFPEEAWATEIKAGTVFPERSLVINSIERASREYDVVAVHFHWGEECRSDPKEYQRELAHLVIDHGADLVIGHHPHVLQGIEIYKNRLIFYSLGNFIFASYSEKAKTSIIASITFNHEGKILKAEIIPVNVYNLDVDLQPKPLPNNPAILDEIRKKSDLVPNAIAPVINSDGSLTFP